MKKIALFLNILACLASGATFAQTDAANVDTVKKYLRIFYVQRPTSSAAPITLDLTAISQNTFGGVFFADTSVVDSHNMIKALLSSTANGGDTLLRKYVAKVLTIQKRFVGFYVVNDNTAIPTASKTSVQNRFGICYDSNDFCWPCAITCRQDCNNTFSGCTSARSRGWLGSFSIGNNFVKDNMFNLPYCYGTIIHELTHTQDNSDSRPNFLVNNNWQSYGADDMHNYTELIPDPTMSFKEGLANYFSSMYDPTELNSIVRAFTINDTLMVERPVTGCNRTPTVDAGAGGSGRRIDRDVFLACDIERIGIPRVSPPVFAQNGYDYYRFNSLPASTLMHNEMMITLVLSAYSQSLGADIVRDGITNATQIWCNNSDFALATLFNELSRIGMNNVHTDTTSIRNGSYTGAKPYLIPLAMLDVFTKFEGDKAQFLRLFNDGSNRMRFWVDAYWDGRTALKESLRENTRLRSIIRDIRVFYGLQARTLELIERWPDDPSIIDRH
jgi:hypothetical protein